MPCRVFQSRCRLPRTGLAYCTGGIKYIEFAYTFCARTQLGYFDKGGAGCKNEIDNTWL